MNVHLAKTKSMKSIILLLVSLVALYPLLVFGQATQRQWTIDEVFRLNSSFKSFGAVRWIEGGKKFSYMDGDTATRQRNVYSYTVANGKRELLIDAAMVAGTDGKKIRIGSYEWSADGENILVTGTLTARRTKTGGRFGLYNIRTKTFRMVRDSGEQAIIKLSPDGKKIGFVRGNNLFVMDAASGKETQLTLDGSENILNGKFDWVYEEEFSIIDGWQWSPDSRQIAFWRLDQSAVPTFPIVRYPKDDSHAVLETMRYPKAGDRNSLVRIGVINLENKKTQWLNLGSNPDIYVPRIQWTNDPNVLCVQRLNRGQDTLDLMLANTMTGSLRTILTETDTAWLEVERDDLTFLKKSKQFVWVSYRDGFTHIYLYSLDGKLDRQITKGSWDVSDVLAVDEEKGFVFFTAAKESPLERHVYSIKLDGTGLKRLTKEAGWHSASLSPDNTVMIDTYSNAVEPTQIWLKKTDGSSIVTLVKNTLDLWKGLPVTQNSFFIFKTPDGLELNGCMLKPADFSPTKKYPVFMFVYGAGSQTVVNRWGGRNYVWYQLLAQHGYIVVSVDPRGTDGRGKTFRQITNRQLGLPNTKDLIEGAKYLGSLPYVDASRIGIWGWSGGGYHTLMAMTYGAEYFKTGIAVAAVTDFKFYDTIWTERYMDTPQSNPEGYKITSPITYASKFKGNLLIVHGTTDDNVHWQNVIVFEDELIKSGKQFETLFYPGRAHGISDAAAQKHLFTKMTNFILEKL